MNLRMSVTAAVAVLLASLSLNSVIAGNGWLGVGIGAVLTVAAAGIVTRLAVLPYTLTATFLILLGVVPLLAGPSWAVRAAGLIVLALPAISATGVRLFRFLAIIATYLAGLLLYVNVAFARAWSFAYIVPTSSSLHMLDQLTRQAFADFKYRPPITDFGSVSMVAGAGVGLVAILVDLLAVRLRRPAIAGLPLLMLYCVPVATNLKAFGVGQSITFALGLAGYLALLSADGRERLRMWGRLVTFRHVQRADEAGARPDTRELSASGRRIGLAAMCLAVLIPLAVPGLRAHDVFATTGNGSGNGGGAAPLQPLLQVTQELGLTKPEPVLSYQTTAAQPQEQYLQEYVLNYDARRNNWLPAFPSSQFRAMNGTKLPAAAAGLSPTTPAVTVKTTITTGAAEFGQAILPMPYAPVDLSVPGGPWLEVTGSSMVFATRPLANLTYTVTSREAEPTAKQVSNSDAEPPGILAQYATYNGPDANKLLAIALAHTSNARTPLEAAIDLQDWFLTGGFTYSIKTNLPHNSHWLLAFLTHDKRGVCRQFAWAFAVLARLAGIPSRIAVGYTGGSEVDGVWRVTTADAHAWPELYFPGDGWLRFEPTPGGDDGQGTATVPRYAAGAPVDGVAPPITKQGTTKPSTLPGGSSKGTTVPNRITRVTKTGADTASRKPGGSGAGYAIGIAAIVVLLLLGWPAVTRWITRRRRWLTASGDAALAHAAWRELVDDMADYGHDCGPGETPRAVARRVARMGDLDPAAARAVARIGAAEERARYSLSAEPGAGLRSDVLAVRKSIAASSTLGQRLHARLIPPSTMSAASQLLQRAGDLFNWLDASWPTVRRQLRSSVPGRSGLRS
jgi:TgpA N-terminal domain/Transglutaminase-like superfamily/Domain of unknown function (DUF4129)